MASPLKPWKAEYAKSARSSCKTCKSVIGKDQFRLGKMVVATQFDGFMPYMDKPPKGKHSRKGLGKMVPLESEFVNWRDEVVVPCGKPVPSKVKTSELMYNEYIVYDTAQVKMQFLLKVRFHHKR